jgi:ankyrin repeat protein
MTPLHVAVINQNSAMVRILLKAGANPNIPNMLGNSPLYDAIGKSDEIVDLLLRAGADPNVQMGVLLYSVIVEGNLAQVKMLLNNGANLNIEHVLGKTFLQIALEVCENAHSRTASEDLDIIDLDANRKRATSLDIIKVLIKAGAKLNVKKHHCHPFFDIHGETPLNKAARREYLSEIAIMMINHGADLNAEGIAGSTVLHQAAGRKDFELVKLLILAGADLTVEDSEGNTAYSIAYNGHWQAVRDKNDLSEKAYHKITTQLRITKDINPVKYFIEQAASEKIIANKLKLHSLKIDDLGEAFKAAIAKNNINYIKQLLSYAEKNKLTNFLDNQDVIDALNKWLISANNDITTLWDRYDIARFANACYFPDVEDGYFPVVAKEPASKERLDAIIKHIETIIRLIAISEMNNDLVTEDEAAFIDSARILFALRNNNPRIAIDIIQSRRTNLNYRDSEGNVALILAIERFLIFTSNKPMTSEIRIIDDDYDYDVYYQELISLLIKNSTDINIRAKNGDTALHLAAQAGNEKLMDLLVSNGANLHLKDKQGRTPQAIYLSSADIESISTTDRRDVISLTKSYYLATSRGDDDHRKLLLDNKLAIPSVMLLETLINEAAENLRFKELKDLLKAKQMLLRDDLNPEISPGTDILLTSKALKLIKEHAEPRIDNMLSYAATSLSPKEINLVIKDPKCSMQQKNDAFINSINCGKFMNALAIATNNNFEWNREIFSKNLNIVQESIAIFSASQQSEIINIFKEVTKSLTLNAQQTKQLMQLEFNMTKCAHKEMVNRANEDRTRIIKPTMTIITDQPKIEPKQESKEEKQNCTIILPAKAITHIIKTESTSSPYAGLAHITDEVSSIITNNFNTPGKKVDLPNIYKNELVFKDLLIEMLACHANIISQITRNGKMDDFINYLGDKLSQEIPKKYLSNSERFIDDCIKESITSQLNSSVSKKISSFTR